MSLLTIDSVSKHFGGVQALDRVSFSVEGGRITSLIGPNGAGKTTLFNCISGLTPIDEGSIRLHVGEASELSRLRPERIASRGVLRTFQNLRVFRDRTVLENVMIGTYHATRVTVWDALFRPARVRREEAAAADTALRMLRLVQLEAYADQPAAALPYGVLKRLEIARALAARPMLLLLDEPVAGLNRAEKDALSGVLLGLRERGLSILMIEHDMRFVMPLSDHVVVLDYGELIAQGPPSQIQCDERVIEAYLGTTV